MKRKKMLNIRGRWRGDIASLIASVWMVAASSAQGQALYVYPAEGQSAEQQSRDTGECQAWATQQSGYDPLNPPVVVSGAPAPQGGVGRGAVRGAAIGVVGGAIAGDAGTGAAVGAATGGLIGGMRRRDQLAEQQAAQAQQQATVQQGRNEFDRAFTACMQARKYSIQ
jgi:hypothetical protein